jgi:hypothetical protein
MCIRDRFETIQKDWRFLMDKFGLPSLPHKNQSKHRHYSSYYDEETIELATKYYKQDLEQLGYKFEKI